MNPLPSPARPGHSDRRGVTLVEILVAMLLSISVLIIAWRFFGADQRRFRVDQNRLTGLQGGLILEDALAMDLEQIAVHPVDGLQATYHEDEPVRITPDRSSVSFLRFAPTGADTGPAAVVEVAYQRDPRTGRVTRQEGSSSRTFRSLVAEQLQFQLLKLDLDFDRPPLQGLAFTYGRGRKHHVLKFRITAASERILAGTGRPAKAHERVTLVGAVPFAALRSRHDHPYWGFTGPELLEAPP